MMHGRIKPKDISFRINSELGANTILLFGISSDLQQVCNWGWIEVDSIVTLEAFLNRLDPKSMKKHRTSDAQFLKSCGISGGVTVA